MGEEFVAVCRVGELADGDVHGFTVPGQRDSARVLVNVDGSLYALSGTCTHLGADLSEGIVERGIILCPLHGSGFDCRTGEAVHPPADAPLESYPVAVRDDTVYVQIEP